MARLPPKSGAGSNRLGYRKQSRSCRRAERCLVRSGVDRTALGRPGPSVLRVSYSCGIGPSVAAYPGGLPVSAPPRGLSPSQTESPKGREHTVAGGGGVSDPSLIRRHDTMGVAPVDSPPMRRYWCVGGDQECRDLGTQSHTDHLLQRPRGGHSGGLRRTPTNSPSVPFLAPVCVGRP